MKLVIFSLLFFVIRLAVAQTDTLNQTGADGKRIGYWKIYGKTIKHSQYHSDSLVEEGLYDAGKKTGIWKRYHVNGKLKSEIEFKNNRPNGKFVLYYDNGFKEEAGTWKANYFYGEYKRWWENGCIAQEKTYNSSNKVESYIYYFADSCGLKESEYNITGQMMYVSYNKKGEIIRSERHPSNANDKIVPGFSECLCEVIVSDTLHTFYKEKHKIVLQGEFKNKKIYNGKCSIYQNDSVLIHYYEITDGKQYFKPIKYVTDYQSDKPKNGYYKTYDLEKRLFEDGEFKDDKLFNGKKYIYDKNGLIYKIEIYKNGKYWGDAALD